MPFRRKQKEADTRAFLPFPFPLPMMMIIICFFKTSKLPEKINGAFTTLFDGNLIPVCPFISEAGLTACLPSCLPWLSALVSFSKSNEPWKWKQENYTLRPVLLESIVFVDLVLTEQMWLKWPFSYFDKKKSKCHSTLMEKEYTITNAPD